MAYESFYGGRQGISFILVEHYTSIDSMLADFRLGGVTTSKVNYGEYVIVDTTNKNDLANGCIYRRGMNYSDKHDKPPYPQPGEPTDAYMALVQDPGCGAEYIGQVRGPEGTIKELQVGEYKDNVLTKGEYTPTDMESGKETNSIKYSLVNVTNEIGDIVNYLIGFRFPYLVQEFEGVATDPYDRTDLITDITGEDISERPFYRKWEVRVPQGIKGNTVGTVSSFPTIIKKGSKIYNQVNEETGHLFDPLGELSEDLVIEVKEYLITKDKNYVKFEYQQAGDKYAYLVDGGKWHIGFSIVDYSESAEGTTSLVDGGTYRTIDNAYINTGETEGAGDQQLHIIYSDGTDSPVGLPINYIVKTVITENPQEGSDTQVPGNHLLVWYSDRERRRTLPTVRYNNEDGWYDLGYVKGDPGGIPSLGEVASLNDLYDDQGNPYPPERVIYPHNERKEYAGFVVTIKEGSGSEQQSSIYAYDYIHPERGLYYVGKVMEGTLDATKIFVLSKTMPSTLDDNGIWGFMEDITTY